MRTREPTPEAELQAKPQEGDLAGTSGPVPCLRCAASETREPGFTLLSWTKSWGRHLALWEAAPRPPELAP